MEEDPTIRQANGANRKPDLAGVRDVVVFDIGVSCNYYATCYYANAILDLINFVSECYEEENCCIGTLFDLSKVFDCVLH